MDVLSLLTVISVLDSRPERAAIEHTLVPWIMVHSVNKIRPCEMTARLVTYLDCGTGRHFG